MCTSANGESNEIGGILGSDKDGIITDIILDKPVENAKRRDKYYPNVGYLNKEIEMWSKAGKDFLGIFHTHFAGSTALSVADKEYIKKIMFSVKESVKYLYFPIYTLPNQILTAYKAFFEKDKLIIIRDELDIVQ